MKVTKYGMWAVAIAAIAICMVPPAGAKLAGEWHTEVIDEGHYYPGSLGLDDYGRPHVAYFDTVNRDLRYATRTAAGWVVRGIGGRGDTGYYPSLAINTHGGPGSPCVAYFDNTMRTLRYAWIEDGEWTRSTVAPGHVFSISLAVTSTGYPRIAYIAANGDLKYAWKNSGSWHTTTVDSGDYEHVALALDSGNNPHISYLNRTANDLKYAWKDADGWHNSTRLTIGDIGFYTSIACDSTNNPHISYPNWPADTLGHMWKNGTWNSQTVTSGQKFYHTSIQLDRDDNPRISFWNVSGEVSFAWKEYGTWHNATVDTVLSRRTSLALTRQGMPRILYDDRDTSLKYAWFVPAPQVSAINPPYGDAGATERVTITGRDFRNSTVRLVWPGPPGTGTDPVPATHLFVLSSQITCRFPVPLDAAPGLWSVEVTNRDGQVGVLPFAFDIWSFPAPTVTGITPGHIRRGRTVSVTNLSGTGFRNGAAVSLRRSGTAIEGYDVVRVSSSQITCRFDIPADAETGLWNVRVTNRDTRWGSLAGGFEVLPAG